MTNQRSLLLLLAGAVVMIGAVVGALYFAGSLSTSDEPPAVAMSKADVEKIIKNYITENPQIILESVQRMQAENEKKEDEERLVQMRAGIKTHGAQLFNEAEPIIAGNPKGDVTVVEFFDYRCPYCHKVVEDVSNLVKQDGGIRLVMKEFPILSKESALAAHAAVASVRQGKYWNFHVKLMGAEELNEERIFAIAKDVGLDVNRLRADMADPKVAKRLKDTDDLARALGINATPTFFVGEQPLTGAKTLSELKEAVAAARKARPS